MKLIKTVASDIKSFGEMQVGDIIEFRLKTGETVAARAVEKRGNHKMVMYFVDCLKGREFMNSEDSSLGGWMSCVLRKELNGDILDSFPDEIKAKMLPTETGDLLRLATETQIFGGHRYGQPESFERKLTRWPCMKNRRNRISFQRYGADVWEWSWLMNQVNDTGFACVGGSGSAACLGASYVRGVRPLFVLDLRAEV